MTSSIISSRYARSLFDLSLEMDILEKVNDDMVLVKNVCKDNKVLSAIMRNPNINIGSKKGIVKELFESRIEKLSLNFVTLLVTKRRVVFLKEIAEAFLDFYNEHKGIKVATLIVASPMEKEIRDKIIKILEKQFDCKIELVEKIDHSVLGGFKILIDDKVYDASVSNQLIQLKKSFAKNLYEKGF
ncbi:MAG: ATP synthase F1 subunit delta [Bacteroidales bacterium]|nr:ATP synthase F1 subunit delta [Bacteroidales bacterium]